jgi:hypothetical protein
MWYSSCVSKLRPCVQIPVQEKKEGKGREKRKEGRKKGNEELENVSFVTYERRK